MEIRPLTCKIYGTGRPCKSLYLERIGYDVTNHSSHFQLRKLDQPSIFSKYHLEEKK